VFDNKDFFEKLYGLRSDIPPFNPEEGSFYMDLSARVYVFLDNAWAEVEDIRFDESERKEINLSDFL
jgi:uncharacterized membrane protein YukC